MATQEERNELTGLLIQAYANMAGMEQALHRITSELCVLNTRIIAALRKAGVKIDE